MSQTDSKPNILIILSDDHGYGDISIHDGPCIQTPHIDRIASEGIRFTRFYANSSVCSPSRASLLTGRYPDRVGVPGVIRACAGSSWGYFSQDAVTLPSMLNRAGYHSTLIGKWHLGLEPENHPCRRGFDHFQGFLDGMMDDYYTHLHFGRNFMRKDEAEIQCEGHATDIFTEWAVDFIEGQARSDRPFFLYLGYNAPHEPIQPPDEWFERVRKREPDASPKRARYVALVEHMDDGIGKVLGALQRAGQLSNTLVFYTSDNGGRVEAGACNGPLRGQKGDVYEGGIRVPACAMWPGRIPEGVVADQVTLLMDLFPTVCEAAGVDVDHEIEGSSILPTLLAERQDLSSRILYWIRREGGIDGMRFLGLCQHAVRLGDQKLMHNSPFDPLELYDLGEDPREESDRSAAQPDTVTKMAELLQHEVQQAGAIPWQKHNSRG